MDIWTFLTQIERENNIQIIFAIESGSRVWGFESTDSDYDIRFVFVRNFKEYIHLDEKNDVINKNHRYPGLPTLDAVGFDLLKFCRLLRRSNPSCIEWLMSPTIYRDSDTRTKLFDWACENFNPLTLWYHHQSISWKHYCQFIVSEKCCTPKKYLYALRGALASLFIKKNTRKLPPIQIQELMKIQPDLSFIISQLIEKKRSQTESTKISRIQVLDDFLEQTHDNTYLFQKDDSEVNVSKLQEIVFNNIK